MPTRGKLIVLGILLLAGLLAAGNFVYQAMSSRRALRHWGRNAGELIVAAPKVEALRLDGGPQKVLQRVDASQARGLLHVRRALVADRLFDWHDAPVDAKPDWQYALRFDDGEGAFMLLLSKDCDLIAAAGDSAVLRIRLNENGQSPLREFIEEQFSTDAASTSPQR